MATKSTKTTTRKSASAARAEGEARTKRALAEAKRNAEANLKAIDAAKKPATANTAAAPAKDGAKATTGGKPAKNATRANDAAKTAGASQARDHTTRPNAKASADPSVKRMSLLDAAAEVLAAASEPMRAKAIADAAIEKRLWTPGAGKTPHATLHAAMTREINTKGAESRFRKADRGLFTTTGKGA